jgi:acyl dehydratase
VDALLALAGRTFGPTAWRTVTQEDVDLFASLSGDRQWIHVDRERAARESPYGTTIAHGNLTLALLDGFRDELLPVGDLAAVGVNLGYDRVRFPAPVPVGSRVRATMEVTAVEPRDGGWWRLHQRFTVEREDEGRPVCVAESVVQVTAPRGPEGRGRAGCRWAMVDSNHRPLPYQRSALTD